MSQPSNGKMTDILGRLMDSAKIPTGPKPVVLTAEQKEAKARKDAEAEADDVAGGLEVIAALPSPTDEFLTIEKFEY